MNRQPWILSPTRHRNDQRPWRLVVMITGLLVYVVGIDLPTLGWDIPPVTAMVLRNLGGTIFTVGIVWAIARVIRYERRRQALRSPLARTVDRLPKRRPHA